MTEFEQFKEYIREISEILAFISQYGFYCDSGCLEDSDEFIRLREIMEDLGIMLNEVL